MTLAHLVVHYGAGSDQFTADPSLATPNRRDRSETTNGETDAMGDEHRKAEPAADPEAGRRRDQDAGRAAPASTSPLAVGGFDGQEAALRANAASSDNQERSEEHRELSAGTETETSTGGATETTEADRQKLSLDDLEFHAVRAIRYHEARGTFLDLWRRLLDFGVILLGAGAVTSLAAEGRAWPTILNLSTASIGAIQLVANLGDRAQEHRWVRKKYCELLARVTEAKLEDTISSREMRKLTKRWSDLWGDEVSTMHIVEAVAYNAAVRALNGKVDKDELIEISRWQSFTRNLLSWEGFEPLTRAERAARDGTDDASPKWWQRSRA